MSEDSNSCYDLTFESGHDDCWTHDKATQTESDEVDVLIKNIRLCQKHFFDHCEWHFIAYRQAIRQMPSGLENFQQIVKEFQDRNEPRCRACELDDLLTEIADLKRFRPNQMAAESKKRIGSLSPTDNDEKRLCMDKTDEPKTKS